jgi:hypothetical protein
LQHSGWDIGAACRINEAFAAIVIVAARHPDCPRISATLTSMAPVGPTPAGRQVRYVDENAAKLRPGFSLRFFVAARGEY